MVQVWRVARPWTHVLFMAVLSTTVVTTSVTATPAVAVPSVPGIDVSKYQGRIDWRAVASTPVRFVIVRATLGNRYRDGRFAMNVAGARRNGLAVGAYHFAKPGPAPWDPRVEADHFLDVVQVRTGDVVPVLDIEETGGLSPLQLRTWASAWLDRVEARTGVRAMIYSGNHFWQDFMRNTPWFAQRDHPLWVAHWYVAAPDVPAGRWGGRGFTVWQWSSTGRVAGIRGPVDLDRMKGRIAGGTIASITVRPAKGGVITAERIACGGRLGWCSRLANPGDAITLRAIPGDGARLIRWTGACASAGGSRTCTVTALRDKSLSAVFGHPIETAVPEAGAPEPELSAGTSPVAAPHLAPPRPRPEPASNAEHEADGAGTRLFWSRERDRGSIGGSYRWERRASASISFDFRGGSVTLFTIDGRRMGKARVSIDGEPVKTIDGYAPRSRAGIRHRFTGLGAGPHRLTITSLGTGHRRATDRRIVVDALRWGGRLHRDAKPEAASWAKVDDPSASAGAYVVSDAPGAAATLRFSGSSLTLRTLRGPARGRAEIWIDGRRLRTIDLFARTRRFVSIRVARGLDRGPHVARLVVVGTHRRTSRGSWVAIDRWTVS
jgi:lysozyme